MPRSRPIERVAIVGARDYPHPERVRDYVCSLPKGTLVISGGADGVDTWAAEAAREHGLEVSVYPPRSFVGGADRCLKGRERYLYRNTLLAIECDRMVAFVGGSKGGTWDAVRQAKRFKRPVREMQ